MTRSVGRGDGRRKSVRRAAVLLVLFLAAGFAGCLWPWERYAVSPVVSGRMQGPGEALAGASLMLTIRHRENPSLFESQRRPIGEGGEFAFAPVALAIAGKEYSKFYRAYLHLRDGDDDRVIWRAEFSRLRVEAPIELDCDVSRPIAQGQPCQIRDPLRHGWLVEAGERTYGELCVVCHGADARGRPGGPPDLGLVAARRGGRFDRVEVAEWIEGRSIPRAHEVGGMPVWGERLSQEYARYAEGDDLIGARLDPVLAYLESLQREP